LSALRGWADKRQSYAVNVVAVFACLLPVLAVYLTGTHGDLMRDRGDNRPIVIFSRIR